MFPPISNDTNVDRVIAITDGHETWEMKFPSNSVSDSEALHHLLCYIHPGDDYSVKFSKFDIFENSMGKLNEEIAEEHGVLMREMMHETVDEYYY